MKPEWVPREQNQLADYYSCLVNLDDYSLNPAIFDWLNSVYSKTAIQAIKKDAAKSGSPTQDGQGEKVGGGQEMAVMVGLWQNF